MMFKSKIWKRVAEVALIERVFSLKKYKLSNNKPRRLPGDRLTGGFSFFKPEPRSGRSPVAGEAALSGHQAAANLGGIYRVLIISVAMYTFTNKTTKVCFREERETTWFSICHRSQGN